MNIYTLLPIFFDSYLKTRKSINGFATSVNLFPKCVINYYNIYYSYTLNILNKSLYETE